MITEQELELAVQLNKDIRDLKVLIAKLEETKISRNVGMNSGISIEGNKVEVNDYTQHLLQKFKDDVVYVHKVELKELKQRYSDIIETPGETLRRILEEDG